MADCFIMRYGGSSAKSETKIIYNLPLQENLDDISGYSRTSVYSGDTPQTITVDNGLYLYSNQIKLDMGFLNDVVDNKFKIDFDFMYNSTGTSSYPQYRRLIWWYPYGVELTSNYIKSLIYTSSDSHTTSNKYDGNWHHATLICDIDTKSFAFIIDNNTEALYLSLGSSFPTSYAIYLGETKYGLNGYIKNLIITTGGE